MNSLFAFAILPSIIQTLLTDKKVTLLSPSSLTLGIINNKPFSFLNPINIS